MWRKKKRNKELNFHSMQPPSLKEITAVQILTINIPAVDVVMDGANKCLHTSALQLPICQLFFFFSCDSTYQ